MWDENGNLACQLTCVKKEKRIHETYLLFLGWGVKTHRGQTTGELLNFTLLKLIGSYKSKKNLHYPIIARGIDD